MKLLLNVFLAISAVVSVFSQSPTTTPIKESKTPDQIRQENIEKQQEDGMLRKNTTLTTQAAEEGVNPDYLPPRKPVSLVPTAINPTREQAKRLRPSDEDLAKYADFLKQPNTKLIRLFSDLGCSDKNLIRVDDPCLDSVPLSSFYSLRKKNYSEKELFDIGLKDDSFSTDGLLSNGIIVNLGNIPLESLSLASEGIKFLADYGQASKYDEVLAKSEEITRGIKVGNYNYAKTVPATENTTYAIRVIAYRGNVPHAVGKNQSYNELDGDKRVDIIGVFRVVRKDQNGSLILLWKELQRKDSPKIKTPKEK